MGHIGAFLPLLATLIFALLFLDYLAIARRLGVEATLENLCHSYLQAFGVYYFTQSWIWALVAFIFHFVFNYLHQINRLTATVSLLLNMLVRVVIALFAAGAGPVRISIGN